MQLVFMGKPIVGMFNIGQCAVCNSSVSIAYPSVSIAYPSVSIAYPRGHHRPLPSFLGRQIKGKLKAILPLGRRAFHLPLRALGESF